MAAPEFPASSTASVSCIQGKDRKGKPTEQFKITFPPALSTAQTPRAFNYALEMLDANGTVIQKTCVLSTHFFYPENKEPDRISCLFAAIGAKRGDTLKFTVCPLDSFGKEGRPLSVNFIWN